MKIGIDAKWLFRGHISGKLFIQNVLPQLFKLYPTVEWHIFLDKKDKDREPGFSLEGVNVHYIPVAYNMLSNVFVIPRHAKKLGLDAVLFQTFSPKANSFRSVVFIHDVLFKTYPRYFTWKERLYFRVLRLTAPRADRIITTTEFVRKELQRHRYAKPGVAIDVSPSGVTDLFKPYYHHERKQLDLVREKYHLPERFILSTGRLNARKNIKMLVESLPLLKERIPMVIVGKEDWKSPGLNGLEPGLKKDLIFTGFVPGEDLAAIYAMARIFCFPSFAEGFGLPPLEAMASGIPVIVSATTAMPEVCGEAALFINPHDPIDIAAKINELLSNQALYEEKVKQGLAWSRQYTWKRTAEGIMKSILAAVEEQKTNK